MPDESLRAESTPTPPGEDTEDTQYRLCRSIAESLMGRERVGHTLQATALVHEAWIRLAMTQQRSARAVEHRGPLVARVMRNVLVDHARKRKARGGEQTASLVDVADLASPDNPKGRADLLDLTDALEALAQVNNRLARVLELRYFGGLSLEEIAETLGLSRAIVSSECSIASAWIKAKLSS